MPALAFIPKPEPVANSSTACRILYVVGQLRAGGLERQLWTLLKTIDRQRYRPAVAVWSFHESDQYVEAIRQLGVPLYYPTPGVSGAAKLRWFRSLARQLRPGLIHSYSFYTNFGAWYAATGTDTVAVGSVRSDFSRAVQDSGVALGRLSAHWPRAQIFNSAAAAEQARRSGGPFVPRHIHVVRNGLDLQQFRCLPLPKTGRVKIVGVGSLTAVKRWDVLINAAARLKRQGLDFSVKIAGDGPLRKKLSDQVRSAGVEDRVSLLGHSGEVPRLLSEVALLAHTSDSEGCPNVLMEAMACGRPVVATNAGDTRWLVDEGITGFVVRRGDEDTLCERLAKLITDPDLRSAMGRAGRAKAEKLFGLDRLLAETMAVYRDAGWNGA